MRTWTPHRHGHHILVGLSALVILASSGPAPARAGSDNDVARLRDQLIAWHTRTAPRAETIERHLRTLRQDGSWPDVDYSSKERGAWPTYRHLTRTLAMAEAYRSPDHPPAGKPELRTAVSKALAHWTENDYTNPNWWYPRIGVPRVMAPILILMGDAVPPELRERTIRQVLGRSKMGMTGQNRVWCAGIAFMKGLLAADRELLRQARDEIFDELRITTSEGIQPDYSFHQHGPQQQWGNYGSAFGGDMIRWATLFRGTDYALKPARLAVLRRYLLEGSSWILWRGRMDISGCGRQIFRNCQAGKGASIIRQLELMASIDPEEAGAYRHAIASNEPGHANGLVGHKHFWRSDVTVHRRPTWYASVKMCSTRVIGAETCNSENMLGLHLGDGATYFYRTGREYEDLFPVWNWRRLPGTTCRQDEGSLVPDSRRCRGQSDFAGGVSDGEHGAAAMEYLRDGLRARKAWFFFDRAVVCLGAAIDCPGPEPVVTSVNQCVLNGPVTVSVGQNVRELQGTEHSFTDLEWVHHDGIGYAFPEPQRTIVAARTQSGNWHSVHHRESKRMLERDVFGLRIDHGVQPAGAQYAYVVFPDVSVAAMHSLSTSPPVTILRRTASLGAVASEDAQLVQAAFFEPDRLTWGDGLSIEVNRPCLVIFDRAADTPRLHVADPTHTLKTIRVRLFGKYTGRGMRYDPAAEQTEVVVDLPQEGLAGQTVSLELRS